MLEVGKKYGHGPRGIVYIGKEGNYHLFLEQNCGTKTWHALTAESASSLKLDNNNYFPLNLFTEACVNCGLEMGLETTWKLLGEYKGELYCPYCGAKNKMCANCPSEATLCKYQDTHHCWMMTGDSEEQLEKYAVANEGGCMTMKWNEIQKQYTIKAIVETEWFMGFRDELGILDYERDDWHWEWKEIRLENKISGELIVVDVSGLTTQGAVISAVEERMSKI